MGNELQCCVKEDKKNIRKPAAHPDGKTLVKQGGSAFSEETVKANEEYMNKLREHKKRAEKLVRGTSRGDILEVFNSKTQKWVRCVFLQTEKNRLVVQMTSNGKTEVIDPTAVSVRQAGGFVITRAA